MSPTKPYPSSSTSSSDAATTTTIEELFLKRSLKDIRAIYDKTRDECQAKQNDLRSLVGERYHDLIDASDGILKIKELCDSCTMNLDHVSHRIQHIESLSIMTQKNQEHITSHQKSSRHDYENETTRVMNCVRELLDLLNLSFICRNKEYYFDFCVCYLSTDHMYRRQLTIEQRKQYAFLDSKIASMEYDKLRVIEICEAKLKQVNLMDVEYTQCLCVVLLLKNSIEENEKSSENLLRYFLQMRKQLISGILTTVQDGQYIENAILALDCFHSTLLLSHVIFDVECSGCGLLKMMMIAPAVLRNCLFTSDADRKLYKTLYEERFDALVDNMKNINYQFANIKLLSREQIKTLCDNWVNEVLPMVKRILQYVTEKIDNASELTQLEDVTRKYVFNYCDIGQEHYQSSIPIKSIFNDVLSAHKSFIWDDVQMLFLNREKSIIQFKFSTVFLVLEKRDQEHSNIGEKLWNTFVLSDEDMINRYYQRIKYETVVSNPYSQFHTQAVEEIGSNKFSLDIFISGINDRIKSVVGVELFQKQLKPIVEDLFLFVKRERAETTSKVSDRANSLLTHDDKEGEVEKVLYENFFTAIGRICNNIENEIENSVQNIDHELFLAYVCQSIKSCIFDIVNELINHANDSRENSLYIKSNSMTQLLKKRQKWLRIQKNNEEKDTDPILKLFDLEQTLDSLYLSAHRSWITSISDNFVKGIAEAVKCENWKEVSRKELWHEITLDISEDNLKELILLPLHPSSYIHAALHSVNVGLYSIGAFEVQKAVLRKLSFQLGDDIFQFYTNFLNFVLQTSNSDDTINSVQNEAIKLNEEGYIQMLFDVRFLGDVLLGTSFERLQLKQHSEQLTSYEKCYVSLVELILNQIDPINWEIYEKIFTNILADCVMRNRLFSPLGVARQYMNQQRRKQENQAELPNIEDSFLKLQNPGTNFSLLPLARKESKQSYASTVKEEISEVKISMPQTTTDTRDHRPTKSSGGFSGFVKGFFGQ